MYVFMHLHISDIVYKIVLVELSNMKLQNHGTNLNTEIQGSIIDVTMNQNNVLKYKKYWGI